MVDEPYVYAIHVDVRLGAILSGRHGADGAIYTMKMSSDELSERPAVESGRLRLQAAATAMPETPRPRRAPGAPGHREAFGNPGFGARGHAGGA